MESARWENFTFFGSQRESSFSRQKVPFFSVSRQNRVKHCQCILNFNILSSFALSSTLPLLSFAILWSNLSLSLLFMCYELWVRDQELLISFDNHLNHIGWRGSNWPKLAGKKHVEQEQRAGAAENWLRQGPVAPEGSGLTSVGQEVIHHSPLEQLIDQLTWFSPWVLHCNPN